MCTIPSTWGCSPLGSCLIWLDRSSTLPWAIIGLWLWMAMTLAWAIVLVHCDVRRQVNKSYDRLFRKMQSFVTFQGRTVIWDPFLITINFHALAVGVIIFETWLEMTVRVLVPPQGSWDPQACDLWCHIGVFMGTAGARTWEKKKRGHPG